MKKIRILLNGTKFGVWERKEAVGNMKFGVWDTVCGWSWDLKVVLEICIKKYEKYRMILEFGICGRNRSRKSKFGMRVFGFANYLEICERTEI